MVWLKLSQWDNFSYREKSLRCETQMGVSYLILLCGCSRVELLRGIINICLLILFLSVPYLFLPPDVKALDNTLHLHKSFDA